MYPAVDIGICKLLHVAFLLLTLMAVAETARIAMIPFPGPSHVSQFSHIGKELQKKGHEIYLILPESYPGLQKHKEGPFHLLTNHKLEDDFYSHDLSSSLKKFFGMTPMKSMNRAVPGSEGTCRNFLSDQILYEKLKSLDIDVFIMDGLPHFHCFYVLPYRLGKPYLTFVTTIAPFWYRNPSLPSFTPFPWGVPYAPDMTFFQRLDNLYSQLQMAWFPLPPHNNLDWSGMYAPERPPLSVNDLLRRSSLWLMDIDPVIDYPRAVMPNEVLIGGVTTQPAKPLSTEFENIVKSAEHGVIVMSFGSMLPDINSERFMKVFSRLKQVVFWRHTSEYKGDIPVPANVHLVKWLPQADLLGHKNTKLFITHCGANGQFEALYHAVPMIAFPGFAEQGYNAKRNEYHGFGKTLNLHSFTIEELHDTIKEILETPSYAENIKHASQIYHDRPMRPLERATYWVEHYLKYGDKHLMSYALEMPWYSYCMVDILAFVAIVCTVFFALLVSFCIFVRNKLSPSKPKKKIQ